MSKVGKLYLIPTTLGDSPVNEVLPDFTLDTCRNIDTFIVEQVRTARRFLSKIKSNVNIDDMTFFELNEHTKPAETTEYLMDIYSGKDIGLLSEAGTPCVADPGNIIVRAAHEQGVEIIPLVGPNSIILALMGSGFNGQNFAFHGYLPRDQKERERKLKDIENSVYRNNQTQIFIETPYRNNQMMASISKVCAPKTKVCVACNLTLPDQIIEVRDAKQWKTIGIDIHKKPAIFLIYK